MSSITITFHSLLLVLQFLTVNTGHENLLVLLITGYGIKQEKGITI